MYFIRKKNKKRKWMKWKINYDLDLVISKNKIYLCSLNCHLAIWDICWVSKKKKWQREWSDDTKMKPDDKSPCRHQRRTTLDGNQSVQVSLVKADLFFSHQSIIFIQDTAWSLHQIHKPTVKLGAESSDSGHCPQDNYWRSFPRNIWALQTVQSSKPLWQLCQEGICLYLATWTH